MGVTVKGMMGPAKPSICRAVIYSDHVLKEHPAVITSVSDVDEEVVNLFVMTDGGGHHWVKDVTHNQDQDNAPIKNSWRWPGRI